MGFRLLFDEMTEAPLADFCAASGHDIRRIVSHPALGPGSDDGEIADVTERERRRLVTYDRDFVETSGTAGQIGIIFGQDDRMAPRRSASVVDAIAEHASQDQVDTHDEPFYLTSDWL